MDTQLTTPGPEEREEMRAEIAMRLRLRRKFYGTGFVVFALVVLGTALAISFSDPAWVPVTLVWAGSAILWHRGDRLARLPGRKIGPVREGGTRFAWGAVRSPACERNRPFESRWVLICQRGGSLGR